MPNRQVHVTNDAADLEQQLVRLIKGNLAKHVASGKKEPFVIGFSGGSMPKVLIPVLRAAISEAERKLVRLFPVDERLVPLNDPENNTKAYLEGLKGLFEEDQFIIPSRIGNEPENQVLNLFNNTLKQWTEPSANQYPQTQLLFLGMGPDGHTCSLFPEHKLLKSTLWSEIITDSPKPPPKRVTITMPLLNAAESVAFILTGEGKAQILKEILNENSTKYPAGLVDLINGSPVHYFLDKPAASML